MFSGVNSGGLRRVHSILEYASRNLNKIGIELPIVMFKEDEETADCMTTAVACVIPDAIRACDFPNHIEEPLLRQFDYDQHDRGEERSAAMLESYDTSEYYKHVEYRNELDALSKKQYKESYIPYRLDSFKFAEFAAWLNTQKLA